LNETLLWLLYLASAVVAFLAVHRFGTRIVPAMIIGTLVTGFGWIPLYFLTSEELRPDFWRVDFSLNVCFGLIFAGAGAAIAFFMATRREGVVRRNEGSD